MRIRQRKLRVNDNCIALSVNNRGTHTKTHLLGIAVVALQAWLGVVCPLTTLEMGLRGSASDATYASTFVSHWMQRILYFSAEDWVFVTAYSIFAMVVLLSWFTVRPRPLRRRP